MTKATRVNGVRLAEFSEPIAHVLNAYSLLSDARIEFDYIAASQLETTRDKPYSARSNSSIIYDGVNVASLVVLAFGQGDATGDYSTFEPGELKSGKFPDVSKYTPRTKLGIFAEAHLTLLSRELGADSPCVLYAGHLGVLGVDDNAVTEIGYIGQSLPEYSAHMQSCRSARPTTTLTTGYKDDTKQIQLAGGERFGDPHAIFNGSTAIQVCGFIALRADNPYRQILTDLNAANLKQFS